MNDVMGRVVRTLAAIEGGLRHEERMTEADTIATLLTELEIYAERLTAQVRQAQARDHDDFRLRSENDAIVKACQALLATLDPEDAEKVAGDLFLRYQRRG